MPVVAFVGRLVREKRLDTVIQTAARLGGFPHRLLIVGEGPDRPMLEKALPDAIFTGHLSGDDLAVAYASSDIFLFPSDTETFGSVTLEAMASALPAVCADATGSRSLVEPDVTGYLAPPGDPDTFAARVGALAGDPGLRARMGAAARARSLTFSWEADMAGLLARYEALADRPQRAVA
jgi:glycosyltransferase involved in cell wall biosynthesis